MGCGDSKNEGMERRERNEIEGRYLEWLEWYWENFIFNFYYSEVFLDLVFLFKGGKLEKGIYLGYIRKER